MKPHSVFTILAILAADSAPIIFNSMRYQDKYFQAFSLIYKAAYISVTMWLSLYALYCWSVYINLRRTGSNQDKNLFFAESARFYRKVLFYIALVPLFMIDIHSRLHPKSIAEQMNKLRYQLRSDFYRDAALAVLETIMLSIVLVELSRLLFPKTSAWSDKKHAAVVIATAVVLSGLRVTALKFASGHGII